MTLDRIRTAPGRALGRAAGAAVAAGLPARRLGYRSLERVPLQPDTVSALGGTYRTLSPARRADNPLPFTHQDAGALSDDPDWFGYAQADVPRRQEGETAIATVPDARLVFHTDEKQDVWVGLVDRRDRALTLREVVARPMHARALRSAPEMARGDAVWICERVYHNHSHWLTAHLPKLVLLRELGLLDQLVMPSRQTSVMRATMRQLGIDPDAVPTVPLDEVARFGELTVLHTDRFRGDLLGPVRDAFAPYGAGEATERVFISRAGSAGRQLLGEEQLGPMLARYGFDVVRMEALSWKGQVELMQRTKVLVGPHGAGLTNMMFCPAGGTVVEIADPLYPNPNFYALACAMGHGYGLVPARSVGEGDHRLYLDLEVEADRLERALEVACR